MARVFDAAVVGVGAMGSAACLRLARAGLRVVGIDRFGIPNTRGSSHGATRILRLGLHESARYVPLVRRAVELWDELGREAGRMLFHRIGSLDISRPDGAIFSGSLRACTACGVEHEVLDAAETARRYPAVRPDADMMSVFQPGSGFVEPEAAISVQAALAMRAGAEIRGHERVLGWRRTGGGGFVVETDRGVYEAGQLVFTTGVWIPQLCRIPVSAERTVLGWFAPVGSGLEFEADRLPVWILDSEECGHFYGFPAHGIPGFKLGRLRETPLPGVDPELLRVEPGPEDEADMRHFVERYFPGANGPVLSMMACFFENTPDRTPVIDAVPGEEGCWVAGGFSGHGFKYSSAVGEVVRDLVTGRKPSFDLAPFSAARLAS